MRYQNFWDFNITLPPFKERKAKDNSDQSLLNKLELTYSSLRNRIDSLDSFFTNE
jgi:hypothetical protein